MKENLKIAKEMLAVARMLMAGEVSDYNTFKTIMTNPKKTFRDFKTLRKTLTPPPAKNAEEDGVEDDEFSDEPMEKIAEELLAVASELMKED